MLRTEAGCHLCQVWAPLVGTMMRAETSYHYGKLLAVYLEIHYRPRLAVTYAIFRVTWWEL